MSNNTWICTDPDTKQYQRKISENQFEMKEFICNPCFIGLHEREVTGIINLNDYTLEEKESYLSAYDLKFNSTTPEILAECIWETDIFEFA